LRITDYLLPQGNKHVQHKAPDEMYYTDFLMGIAALSCYNQPQPFVPLEVRCGAACLPHVMSHAFLLNPYLPFLCPRLERFLERVVIPLAKQPIRR
jgi:hypothetical protein